MRMGLMAVMLFLFGCAQPCYQLVALSPDASTAVIFDSCRGVVNLQNLPPISTDKVGS